MGKIREACGRCSMTSVVDVAETDGEGGANPFDGDRIEVSEAAVRKAAFPAVWLGRAKTRLDQLATRLTYGDTNRGRED
jgi:hypothetical protein